MTTRPTVPREDARARHCRYIGILKWKLGAVIFAIPILLHLALFLFFIGLVILVWSDNTTVAKVVTALISAATFFYLAGNTLPALFDDCPLGTPLSRPLLHLISF